MPLRPLLRSLAQRMRPPAVHPVGAGTGEATGAPLLTVVIPVHNAAPYLRECLDSVLDQSLHRLELVTVDDGSTDGCREILEEYAARDDRVVALFQANKGAGAARNRGIDRARGRFLTFVDADDVLPPKVLSSQVRGLQRTGSDFSVGDVQRFHVGSGNIDAPWWAPVVHRQDRLGITIEDFPEALLDLIACNRMFRTTFWRERVGPFEEGIAYEDHVPMIKAFLRADRFDILQRPVYRWRIRGDLSSLSQGKRKLSNLQDRITVKAQANRLLLDEGSTAIREMWLARVIDTDFSQFIEHALAADEEYRRELQRALRSYVEAASPRVWAKVRHHHKMRTWLAAAGEWERLEDLEQWYREWNRVPPTDVADGTVVVDAPLAEVVGREVPEPILELAEVQTQLAVELVHVRWDGDTVEILGRAALRHVDAHEHRPEIEVELHHRAGHEVAGTVVPAGDLPLRVGTGSAHADHAPATFRARFDVRHLVDTAAGDWHAHVRVHTRGLVREGAAVQYVYGSSASPAGLRARFVGDALVQPWWDAASGFTLGVRLPEVTTTALEVDGASVTGEVRYAGMVDRIVAKAGRRRGPLRADVTSSGDRHRFTFAFPAGAGARQWAVTLVTPDGTRLPVPWPTDAQLPLSSGGFGPGGVSLQRDGSARLQVRTDSPLLEALAASAGQDGPQVTLRYAGLPDGALDGLRLSDPRSDHAVTWVCIDPDRPGLATVWLPTTHAPFGGPAIPLDTGRYELGLGDPDGHRLPVTGSDDFVTAAPVDGGEVFHAWRFLLTASGHVAVRLDPPLTPAEATSYGQRQLRTWYQTADVEPEEAVYFSCYRGEFATDSQRALHDLLREQRPGLRLYWGVASAATPVPTGAVPLQIGSRDWYEKLASARWLCHNIDFDNWFRKRPHQRFLQTFHGYPFKSMGRTYWASKGYSPGRIAREQRSGNRRWDAILVPSEECAEMYRAEYDYRGEILVTGYPRNDELVGADAAAVRSEVLARLGVRVDATVVLYAPTYRDELTTRVYAAKRFDELDLAELTAGLGEDHVVLVRGHNNNQRELDRVRDLARVVDVTDYPEINDLTLAADVAVLDYSSLRFDWAITGKPMVFFVPDMAGYFLHRAPLLPFEETAPGPRLHTTAEVVRALHSPDLVSGYAGEIAGFNRRFNRLHDGHAGQRVLDQFFAE